RTLGWTLARSVKLVTSGKAYPVRYWRHPVANRNVEIGSESNRGHQLTRRAFVSGIGLLALPLLAACAQGPGAATPAIAPTSPATSAPSAATPAAQATTAPTAQATTAATAPAA